MNGYSIIFMVIFIMALALVAGVLSWGLIRGVAGLAHHPIRKHGLRRH